MKLPKEKILMLFTLGIFWFIPQFAQANCKDPDLRQKVAQTAKEEGVDEKQLLSIIAHESGCRYYTIAWNRPGKPQTAKAKFFQNLQESKKFAESLISTKLYRVDVGIGQINNEAHIKPKGWSLNDVLSPDTALKKVAVVLKERTWAKYHSSNPYLAQKWQGLAMAALNRALGKSEEMNHLKIYGSSKRRESGSLLVFNAASASSPKKISQRKFRGSEPTVVFLSPSLSPN